MSTQGERSILLVVHTGRPEGLQTARAVADRFCAAGVTMRVLESEADDLRCPNTTVLPVSPDAAKGAEMVLVIGVNLGHVGFLAETEPEVLSDAVDHILAGHYWVEPRMTIDVSVQQNGSVSATAWALNEATVEKAARERMLDLVTEVDGRPLSRWGCDGMVFATPTGSTAYAFSAGGPVVWPDVEALLLVPISAHALFGGPMVVSPESVLAAEVIGATGSKRGISGAVLWCDGRRKVDLPPGARIEVRRGAQPVLLARLRHDADGDVGAVGPSTSGHGLDIGASFTDRLVAKFGLPVSGWRGRGQARREARQESATHKRDEEPAGDA
jgi:NAD+ kinase